MDKMVESWLAAGNSPRTKSTLLIAAGENADVAAMLLCTQRILDRWHSPRFRMEALTEFTLGRSNGPNVRDVGEYTRDINCLKDGSGGD